MGDVDGRKSIDEGGVQDGIKGRTQVEEDEDGEKTESAAMRRSLEIFIEAVSVL